MREKKLGTSLAPRGIDFGVEKCLELPEIARKLIKYVLHLLTPPSAGVDGGLSSGNLGYLEDSKVINCDFYNVAICEIYFTPKQSEITIGYA